MKAYNDITEELKSLGIGSLLTDMPRTMPYPVPANYFADLPGIVATVAFAGETDDKIPALNKHNPFEIPDQYFETLSGHILNIIKAEDDAEENPKLISLGRQNIWWQVRLAASAVLIFGFGLVFYGEYTTSETYKVESALAALPSGEINAYIQDHLDEFDVDMIANSTDLSSIPIIPKQVDAKEINEYLNDEGIE